MPISRAEGRMVLSTLAECLQSLWHVFRSTLSEREWRPEMNKTWSREWKHDGSAEVLKLSCHFGSKFL